VSDEQRFSSREQVGREWCQELILTGQEPGLHPKGHTHRVRRAADYDTPLPRARVPPGLSMRSAGYLSHFLDQNKNAGASPP
jgi:hypothetical protein